MSKISRNFTVDVEVYEKAKAAGMNMSEAAEEGIRIALMGAGLDVKSLAEIRDEREREREAEEERRARKAEAIAKAYAAGRLVVTEDSPDRIRVKDLYFGAPLTRPAR